MKIILPAAGILIMCAGFNIPTPSWKIKINNKLVLSTSVESETRNIRNISALEWKKNGVLEIIYTDTDTKDWIRSFLFFDDQENPLLTLDSVNTARVPLTELRTLSSGKKTIKIYTVVRPTDPDIAIRIRRIHLCTLRLQ
jgi:hypothetical protein